jgi:hypothetical protein
MPEAVAYIATYAVGEAVAAYTGLQILGTLVTIAASPAVGNSARRRVMR